MRVTLTKRLIPAVSNRNGAAITLRGPIVGDLHDDDGRNIVVFVGVGGSLYEVRTTWDCALGYAVAS